MGTSGQVFKAIDKCNNEEVAVKIIKVKKGATIRAQTEIKLLMKMQTSPVPSDSSKEHNICRCYLTLRGSVDLLSAMLLTSFTSQLSIRTHSCFQVHVLNTFMHNGHQCIVFEPLAMTLYQLLVDTNFRGFKLVVVRNIAKQLLQALAYLARPDNDIIHCDLKPENVMLVSPLRDEVKLIDFGSACKSRGKTYTYIQSRFYRSPEVILGLPYSAAIDMWSLGCMLVELYTGEPRFAGLKDELDMLQRMVVVMGMPPDEMIYKVKKDRQLAFFEREREWWAIKQTPGHDANQLIIPSHDPKSSLKEVITRASAKANKPKENQKERDSFVDMVFQMLTYQPENRLRPDQALHHPFITSL